MKMSPVVFKQEVWHNICSNTCFNVSAIQKQFINSVLYNVTGVTSLLCAQSQMICNYLIMSMQIVISFA